MCGGGGGGGEGDLLQILGNCNCTTSTPTTIACSTVEHAQTDSCKLVTLGIWRLKPGQENRLFCSKDRSVLLTLPTASLSVYNGKSCMQTQTRGVDEKPHEVFFVRVRPSIN